MDQRGSVTKNNPKKTHKSKTQTKPHQTKKCFYLLKTIIKQLQETGEYANSSTFNE